MVMRGDVSKIAPHHLPSPSPAPALLGTTSKLPGILEKFELPELHTAGLFPSLGNSGAQPGLSGKEVVGMHIQPVIPKSPSATHKATLAFLVIFSLPQPQNGPNILASTLR